MLQLGSQGWEVTDLQNKLIARGYSVGSYGADGDFGQGTYDAVVRFQRDHGLEVDGIVGPETMNAIIGSLGSDLLSMGSKGLAVKELQNKLIAKGYSVGSYGADGDFGQGTYDAVVRFQREHNLDADGIVGPATWQSLNGLEGSILLQMGSKGQDVVNLQQKLIARGYSVGSYGADGDFGQGTYDAVIRFQRDHGLDADGIVGPATWATLGDPSTNDILRMGSKGPSVKKLQELLIARGYSVGSYGADGDFGQGTYDAVCAFQSSNGLSVDGEVGPITWDALMNGSSSLLRLGSKGSRVVELQNKLIAKGYSVGSYGADGDFGQGTYDAVCAFQRDHGLDVDGIVGTQTWSALGDFDNSKPSIVQGSGLYKFLEVARSQIGFREGYENITPYGAWFGDNGQPWCAMFISWCAYKSGILGTIIPRYEGCYAGINWYRAVGRYRSRISGYIPKAADVGFLINGSHTFIVEYVNGNEIHTIEGNLSDSVTRNVRHTYDSDIDGYGTNGGISLCPSSPFEEDHIFRLQSQRGFAKLLGYDITAAYKEYVISAPPITVTFEFKYNVPINPDAKLRISGGSISLSDTSGLSSFQVNLIEKALEETSLKIGNLGDTEIRLYIINSSLKSFDIKLEISEDVDGVTCVQSLEISCNTLELVFELAKQNINEGAEALNNLFKKLALAVGTTVVLFGLLFLIISDLPEAGATAILSAIIISIKHFYNN